MKAMICLILDRSGSMAGREADVIGGVNTFLDEQKKLPDPASIAMVRFDTSGVERFRPMQALAEAKHITAEDYQPRGGTPLLDAIGKTLVELDNDWKAEQPERAILVIVTDGQENESHEYTKAKIKEMIESRQSSGKWSIVYLGANVDAFAEAGSMGISRQNTGGYVNTSRGTKVAYAAMSESVRNTRATGATLSANLGRNLGEEMPPAPVVPPSAANPSTPWTPPPDNTGAAPSKVWTPPQ